MSIWEKEWKNRKMIKIKSKKNENMTKNKIKYRIYKFFLDLFENMKIENKSNKIEKWETCDFEGQNPLDVFSKGVTLFDFLEKFGAIQNSSLQNNLID